MLSRARELNLSAFNGEGGSAFPLAPIEVLLARTVRLPSALMLKVVAIISATTLIARSDILLVDFLSLVSLFLYFDLFDRLWYFIDNGCLLGKRNNETSHGFHQYP